MNRMTRPKRKRVRASKAKMNKIKINPIESRGVVKMECTDLARNPSMVILDGNRLDEFMKVSSNGGMKKAMAKLKLAESKRKK